MHEFPDKGYRMPILDVADLKRCLIAAWSGLQQYVIDRTINQWQGRLRACVRADGRHFEHLHHRLRGSASTVLTATAWR